LSRFVQQQPALSLFLLAAAFGVAPMIPVGWGLLPAGFVQLGALSASAAGIVLAATQGGRPGVRELLGRVLIWRVGIGWWLVVLVFPALLAVGAIQLAATVQGGGPSWPGASSPLAWVPRLLFLVVFAGLGEEFGWRGFAVPRVQARTGALLTSLIVGAFHSLWHIPLFFIAGVGQHAIAQQIGFLPGFLGYSVLVTALAVQSSWIFNNTRGSVLLVAVYHGAVNAWAGYIDISPGRLAGMYAYTMLAALASLVIAAVFGAEHLSRTARRVQAGGGA
jgi:hypothetical protein